MSESKEDWVLRRCIPTHKTRSDCSVALITQCLHLLLWFTSAGDIFHRYKHMDGFNGFSNDEFSRYYRDILLPHIYSLGVRNKASCVD